MRKIFQILFIVLLAMRSEAQSLTGSEDERRSLDKATMAIREAFAKGDAALAASLHHPAIVKYFGGNNVVTGRAALEKGLAEWFNSSTVEFTENSIESTVFNGETAVQVVVFSIRSTPKGGGTPVISHGRSMVVYVKDKTSPTGWLSLREISQEAPL